MFCLLLHSRLSDSIVFDSRRLNGKQNAKILSAVNGVKQGARWNLKQRSIELNKPNLDLAIASLTRVNPGYRSNLLRKRFR
jgi:hypothetical protein